MDDKIIELYDVAESDVKEVGCPNSNLDNSKTLKLQSSLKKNSNINFPNNLKPKKRLFLKEKTNSENLDKSLDYRRELKNKSNKENTPLIKLNQLICSLDIGTSSVRCLIAECRDRNNEKNDINIIGFGTSSSRGLRRGVVINIDSTVASIKNTVKQAEEIAKQKINEVYLSITGVHIKSFNSLGVVAIRDKEVSSYDLEKVIEAAKAVAIPPEQELLHVIVQEYIIDGQGGIQQPLGISGVRLEVRVHLVTGLISPAKNLVKCVNKAGLKVKDLIFSPVAASYSVLSETEKEQGVCLIDFGAGTTDVAVFSEGAIIYSGVVGEGSSKVSNSIAQSLKISLLEAERIKCTYGNGKANLISKHESFALKNTNNENESRCSKYELSRIIENDLKSTLNEIFSILNENDLLNSISGGFVLVGEASNLAGIKDLIADYLKLPVRTLKNEKLDINSSITFSGINEICNSPEYANARGLLAYGLNYSKLDLSNSKKGLGKLWKSTLSWLAENF